MQAGNELIIETHEERNHGDDRSSRSSSSGDLHPEIRVPDGDLDSDSDDDDGLEEEANSAGEEVSFLVFFFLRLLHTMPTLALPLCLHNQPRVLRVLHQFCKES